MSVNEWAQRRFVHRPRRLVDRSRASWRLVFPVPRAPTKPSGHQPLTEWPSGVGDLPEDRRTLWASRGVPVVLAYGSAQGSVDS
jgi:hypothetical protein